MGINDNLQGTLYMWQLATSSPESYEPLPGPSRGIQASNAILPFTNYNEILGLIKEYRLLKATIFGCLERGKRKLLVSTENSFTPSIGF